MNRNLSRLFGKLNRDEAGNFAVMAGITLPLLVLSAGIAVDTTNIVRTDSQLQNAVDAAALAAGIMGDVPQEQLEVAAEKHFRANFHDPDGYKEITFDVRKNGNESVTVSATGKAKTYFMKIGGYPDSGVGADATVNFPAMEKMDIALVLDYSGSMNSGGKYQAMREAAINMVGTVMDNSGDGNTRFAIVPFSEYVYTDINTTYIRGVHRDKYNNIVRACLDSRRYPYATQSSTPQASVQDSKWAAPGMPEEFAQSGSLAGAKPVNEPIEATRCVAKTNDDDDDDDDEGGSSYTPDECERTYKAGELIKQAAEAIKSDFALSSDICSKYSANNLLVTPLSADRGMLVGKLNAMHPVRLTNIALGMEFGWHMLTKNEPFTELLENTKEKARKTAVLLTDGEHTVGGFGPNGMFNVKQADKNLEELCTAMKDDDILVVTVAFDLGNKANLKKLLRDCASDPSYFFEPETNQELAAAFKEVVNMLKGTVRLVE